MESSNECPVIYDLIPKDILPDFLNENLLTVADDTVASFTICDNPKKVNDIASVSSLSLEVTDGLPLKFNSTIKNKSFEINENLANAANQVKCTVQKEECSTPPLYLGMEFNTNEELFSKYIILEEIGNNNEVIPNNTEIFKYQSPKNVRMEKGPDDTKISATESISDCQDKFRLELTKSKDIEEKICRDGKRELSEDDQCKEYIEKNSKDVNFEQFKDKQLQAVKSKSEKLNKTKDSANKQTDEYQEKSEDQLIELKGIERKYSDDSKMEPVEDEIPLGVKSNSEKKLEVKKDNFSKQGDECQGKLREFTDKEEKDSGNDEIEPSEDELPHSIKIVKEIVKNNEVMAKCVEIFKCNSSKNVQMAMASDDTKRSDIVSISDCRDKFRLELTKSKDIEENTCRDDKRELSEDDQCEEYTKEKNSKDVNLEQSKDKQLQTVYSKSEKLNKIKDSACKKTDECQEMYEDHLIELKDIERKYSDEGKIVPFEIEIPLAVKSNSKRKLEMKNGDFSEQGHKYQNKPKEQLAEFKDEEEKHSGNDEIESSGDELSHSIKIVKEIGNNNEVMAKRVEIFKCNSPKKFQIGMVSDDTTRSDIESISDRQDKFRLELTKSKDIEEKISRDGERELSEDDQCKEYIEKNSKGVNFEQFKDKQLQAVKSKSEKLNKTKDSANKQTDEYQEKSEDQLIELKGIERKYSDDSKMEPVEDEIPLGVKSNSEKKLEVKKDNFSKQGDECQGKLTEFKDKEEKDSGNDEIEPSEDELPHSIKIVKEIVKNNEVMAKCVEIFKCNSSKNVQMAMASDDTKRSDIVSISGCRDKFILGLTKSKDIEEKTCGDDKRELYEDDQCKEYIEKNSKDVNLEQSKDKQLQTVYSKSGKLNKTKDSTCKQTDEYQEMSEDQLIELKDMERKYSDDGKMGPFEDEIPLAVKSSSERKLEIKKCDFSEQGGQCQDKSREQLTEFKDKEEKDSRNDEIEPFEDELPYSIKIVKEIVNNNEVMVKSAEIFKYNSPKNIQIEMASDDTKKSAIESIIDSQDKFILEVSKSKHIEKKTCGDSKTELSEDDQCKEHIEEKNSMDDTLERSIDKLSQTLNSKTENKLKSTKDSASKQTDDCQEKSKDHFIGVKSNSVKKLETKKDFSKQTDKCLYKSKEQLTDFKDRERENSGGDGMEPSKDGLSLSVKSKSEKKLEIVKKSKNRAHSDGCPDKSKVQLKELNFMGDKNSEDCEIVPAEDEQGKLSDEGKKVETGSRQMLESFHEGTSGLSEECQINFSRQFMAKPASKKNLSENTTNKHIQTKYNAKKIKSLRESTSKPKEECQFGNSRRQELTESEWIDESNSNIDINKQSKDKLADSLKIIDANVQDIKETFQKNENQDGYLGTKPCKVVLERCVLSDWHLITPSHLHSKSKDELNDTRSVVYKKSIQRSHSEKQVEKTKNKKVKQSIFNKIKGSKMEIEGNNDIFSSENECVDKKLVKSEINCKPFSKKIKCKDLKKSKNESPEKTKKSENDFKLRPCKVVIERFKFNVIEKTCTSALNTVLKLQSDDVIKTYQTENKSSSHGNEKQVANISSIQLLNSKENEQHLPSPGKLKNSNGKLKLSVMKIKSAKDINCKQSKSKNKEKQRTETFEMQPENSKKKKQLSFPVEGHSNHMSNSSLIKIKSAKNIECYQSEKDNADKSKKSKISNTKENEEKQEAETFKIQSQDSKEKEKLSYCEVEHFKHESKSSVSKSSKGLNCNQAEKGNEKTESSTVHPRDFKERKKLSFPVEGHSKHKSKSSTFNSAKDIDCNQFEKDNTDKTKKRKISSTTETEEKQEEEASKIQSQDSKEKGKLSSNAAEHFKHESKSSYSKSSKDINCNQAEKRNEKKQKTEPSTVHPRGFKEKKKLSSGDVEHSKHKSKLSTINSTKDIDCYQFKKDSAGKTKKRKISNTKENEGKQEAKASKILFEGCKENEPQSSSVEADHSKDTSKTYVIKIKDLKDNDCYQSKYEKGNEFKKRKISMIDNSDKCKKKIFKSKDTEKSEYKRTKKSRIKEINSDNVSDIEVSFGEKLKGSDESESYETETFVQMAKSKSTEMYDVLRKRGKDEKSKPFNKKHKRNNDVTKSEKNDSEMLETILFRDSDDNLLLKITNECAIILREKGLLTKTSESESNHLLQLKPCTVILQMPDISNYSDMLKSTYVNEKAVFTESTKGSSSNKIKILKCKDEFVPSDSEDNLDSNHSGESSLDSDTEDNKEYKKLEKLGLLIESKLANRDKVKHLICESCNETFPTHILWLKHNIKHHNGSAYKCGICSKKSFKIRAKFMVHIKKFHPEIERTPFVCENAKCKEMFSTLKKIRDHIRCHLKFVCKVCKKGFAKKYPMHLHILKHHLP